MVFPSGHSVGVRPEQVGMSQSSVPIVPGGQVTTQERATPQSTWQVPPGRHAMLHALF
jgi:hypothetical protein